jgi:hypothetical protein
VEWGAFGAIREWLGGLATIGTLFHLAHQVRQSTRFAQSCAYQAAASSISEWTDLIAVDPTIADKLGTAMLGSDQLDAATRTQTGHLFNSLFRNYENIFYQWRERAIGDDVWESWSNPMRGVFWAPGVQAWWPSWRLNCHREFRRFLEASSEPEDETRVWAYGKGS